MSAAPASATAEPAPALSDPLRGAHALAELLRGRRFAVLSGAGLSVDSGIPDYRGPTTRHIARSPVTHDEFVRSPEARRRYWARASRGYAAVAEARPNPAHRALAALERGGHVAGAITQNVDGLHQAAGSRRVVELHGSLHRVTCLGCGAGLPRAEVQARIAADNPGWLAGGGAAAPDGDAEVARAAQAAFAPPTCAACGGALMPDVVFFGGTVPKARAEGARDLVASADGLLVVGSSLTVFSGYRFVRQADRAGLPVAIVTLGHTRGHRHATLAVDAPLGAVLPGVVGALGLTPAGPATSPAPAVPGPPIPPPTPRRRRSRGRASRGRS